MVKHDINRFTAEQARENRNTYSLELYYSVIEKIKERSKTDNYLYVDSEELNDGVQDILEQDGYVIYREQNRNEILTKVLW